MPQHKHMQIIILCFKTVHKSFPVAITSFHKFIAMHFIEFVMIAPEHILNHAHHKLLLNSIVRTIKNRPSFANANVVATNSQPQTNTKYMFETKHPPSPEPPLSLPCFIPCPCKARQVMYSQARARQCIWFISGFGLLISERLGHGFIAMLYSLPVQGKAR